ncbi:hypothetical protein BQ8482_480017 [Mesorhizobium delmotii]|uniref:Uncharacterized protein n=1 Tax=Mesorhizobium delmotii TaxID=1631247 RepID=A0A2P9ATV0_9HYPH|nr:hypothetical protein BQ8482_480017 [Mesorhizobium delmotii]
MRIECEWEEVDREWDVQRPLLAKQGLQRYTAQPQKGTLSLTVSGKRPLYPLEFSW